MFKAMVHSCVSCHSLLRLICCHTWLRIKGGASVSIFFFQFSLTVSLCLYCLIHERAGRLWWLREIEFQSAWLITMSNWGERCGMQRGITAAGKLPVCSGDSLSVRDSPPTPNIRFVSSYFHSFAAGRLFCCTWTSLPFPHLSCTALAAPLHLHVSCFQIL